MEKKNIFLIIVIGLLVPSWVLFFEKRVEAFAIENIFNQSGQFNLAQVGVIKQEIPEFDAKSIISVKVTGDKEKIIFGKDINFLLPIASISKLMTALIIFDNYESNFYQKVKISKEAVLEEGETGKLRVGEEISIKNLLYSLLIESSNDSAFALAEKMGLQNFVDEMNKKGKELGMDNTNFFNPSGLDGTKNYSTTEDLVRLVKYIIYNKPEIFEITSKTSYEILNDNGSLHHLAQSTNELLKKDINWRPELFGGKTGYNEEALGCLILVLKNQEQEYLINVVLGSNDRFGQMEKLINFVKW